MINKLIAELAKIRTKQIRLTAQAEEVKRRLHAAIDAEVLGAGTDPVAVLKPARYGRYNPVPAKIKREIGRLAKEGMSNPAIMQRLHVSRSFVQKVAAPSRKK